MNLSGWLYLCWNTVLFTVQVCLFAFSLAQLIKKCCEYKRSSKSNCQLKWAIKLMPYDNNSCVNLTWSASEVVYAKNTLIQAHTDHFYQAHKQFILKS